MTTLATSMPLIDQVRSILSDLNWEAAAQTDDCLYYHIKGNAGNWTIRVLVEDKADEAGLWFLATMPVTLPEARRHEVADFLMRVNILLSLGNFILEMDSGDVVYAAGLHLLDAQLTPKMLAHYFHAASNLMDEYISPILMVAYGSESAAELHRRLYPPAPADLTLANGTTVDTAGTLQ